MADDRHGTRFSAVLCPPQVGHSPSRDRKSAENAGKRGWRRQACGALLGTLVWWCLRQPDEERGTSAELALYPDIAVVGDDEIAGDR